MGDDRYFPPGRIYDVDVTFHIYGEGWEPFGIPDLISLRGYSDSMHADHPSAYDLIWSGSGHLPVIGEPFGWSLPDGGECLTTDYMERRMDDGCVDDYNTPDSSVKMSPLGTPYTPYYQAPSDGSERFDDTLIRFAGVEVPPPSALYPPGTNVAHGTLAYTTAYEGYCESTCWTTVQCTGQIIKIADGVVWP